MGRFSCFDRKATGREDKHESTSVGPARIAPVPSHRHIASHRTATVHPSDSMPPSAYITSLGPAPIIALPTLAPIQPVSPIRMSPVVRSTSSAPEYSLAEQSEGDDKFSSPLPAEEQEVRHQPEPWTSLSRDTTTDLLYRRPTPPPRMTSATFARLPEYIGSSDSSEHPRTDSVSSSSSSESGDSDTLGMLSPIAPPPMQEDVFSSPSSPATLPASDPFRITGPPTYHAPPPSRQPGPFPSPTRPSRARMDASPSLHLTYAPTTNPHSPHRHRRQPTPYPLHIPHEPSSSPAAPEHQTPSPAVLTVHPPHGFPPTPSSELRESSFLTRIDPLPRSSPMLPRTDEDGIDLQEFLMRNPHLVVGIEEGGGFDEGGVGEGVGTEDWVDDEDEGRDEG